MACGTPCVVTDVGDSAMIVDQTGIVVPPENAAALAEAWRKLVDAGPEVRRRLGIAARHRVQQHFALPIVVERYQAIYAKLAAGSSFQTADVPVQITGVGMFDFPHGQHGAAPNVIELHPVLKIVFNPPTGADFTIASSSDMVRVPQGGSSSITITTEGVSPVALSVSGLPTGVSSDITPIGSGSSTIALTVGSGVLVGSYPFSVTGTAASQSHSQVVDLEVTAASSDESGTKVWEYQVSNATSEQDVIDKANSLGAQGWEMVSVVRVQGSPSWRAFFKRVKPDSER